MDEAAEVITLGKDVQVPVWFKSTVELEGLYRLELHVAFEAGRFVVKELTVKRRSDGPPVTTEGLRELPINALLRVAVEQRMRATPAARSERATGAGPSEEDLRAVADVYRVAYATGAAPTKTVIQRLGLPRSTASRWIRMARERGLLGPATPRKAGG